MLAYSLKMESRLRNFAPGTEAVDRFIRYDLTQMTSSTCWQKTKLTSVRRLLSQVCTMFPSKICSMKHSTFASQCISGEAYLMKGKILKPIFISLTGDNTMPKRCAPPLRTKSGVDFPWFGHCKNKRFYVNDTIVSMHNALTAFPSHFTCLTSEKTVGGRLRLQLHRLHRMHVL